MKTWQVNLKRFREHRGLVWGTSLVCSVVLMLLTPRIPQPQSYHKFVDQRNLIGVPNSMNVISNFPFLVIGVIGLVLCLHGNYLGLSLRGEVWGWACFYVAVTAMAFGSAYYHLKPNDARLMWDRLPGMTDEACRKMLVIKYVKSILSWSGKRRRAIAYMSNHFEVGEPVFTTMKEQPSVSSLQAY